MKKEELKKGRTYLLKSYADGNFAGDKVVFWGFYDDRYAICNPINEPSMQDSFCVEPEHLEELDATKS